MQSKFVFVTKRKVMNNLR